jgi:hypothetical protein
MGVGHMSQPPQAGESELKGRVGKLASPETPADSPDQTA